MTPEYLAWILSLVTFLNLWLMGNKSKWGPRVELVGVGLWVIYTIWLGQWGLMPGNILCGAVQVRNLILWERAGAA